MREPHILAHELRTPLSVLAGWYSLVRDGDISADATPQQWEIAMEACQQAVDRLNFIITQTCDEASTALAIDSPKYEEMIRLAKQSSEAIDHSRNVLARVRRRRAGERVDGSRPAVAKPVTSGRT